MTSQVTRRAFGEPPSPEQVADGARERLGELASEYDGRSAYHRAVQAAVASAREALDRYERSRLDELRAASSALQGEVDRERARADKAEREAAALREAMERRPAKEVEIGDAASRLRFPRPENGQRRGRRWTVSDLETIAFDVRLAGGQDDAPIDVYDQAFVAEVPFPEAVAQRREQDSRAVVSPKDVVDLTKEAADKRSRRNQRWLVAGVAAIAAGQVLGFLSRLFS